MGSDAELNASTDPNLYDTDGDGLGDGEEVDVHGCSPLLIDTDSFDDPTEVAAGSDPSSASSTPPNPPAVPSISGAGLAGLVLLIGACRLAASRNQWASGQVAPAQGAEGAISTGTGRRN